MQLPESPTYRPALAVSFLLCLVWVVLLSVGGLERLPLSPGAKGLVAFLAPLAAAMAILHRTPLFAEMPRARRFINLLGVAFALLVCAGALLLALSLLLFALGIISPP